MAIYCSIVCSKQITYIDRCESIREKTKTSLSIRPRSAYSVGGSALCVEIGFWGTFLGKQRATAEASFEVISSLQSQASQLYKSAFCWFSPFHWSLAHQGYVSIKHGPNSGLTGTRDISCLERVPQNVHLKSNLMHNAVGGGRRQSSIVWSNTCVHKREVHTGGFIWIFP